MEIRAILITTAAALGLALAVHATPAAAQVSNAAQSACMAAVNGEYRGGSDRLDIVHMEFSQANSLVLIDADGGQRWRCLVSNDGYVQELTRQGGGSHQGSGSSHGGSGQGVTLYADYNFRGGSEVIHGSVEDMSRTRIGNDRLSSIAVPRGCRVRLFADNGFRGRTVELYDDEPELGRTAVGNDSVSSIEVDCGDRHSGGAYEPSHGQGSGRGVTLYRDYNFRGASETIHGNVEDMARTRIGNDNLSSIAVPRGCRVRLFTDNGFRGRNVELYDDEPELGRTSVGNDSVSSIEVNCR